MVVHGRAHPSASLGREGARAGHARHPRRSALLAQSALSDLWLPIRAARHRLSRRADQLRARTRPRLSEYSSPTRTRRCWGETSRNRGSAGPLFPRQADRQAYDTSSWQFDWTSVTARATRRWASSLRLPTSEAHFARYTAEMVKRVRHSTERFVDVADRYTSCAARTGPRRSVTRSGSRITRRRADRRTAAIRNCARQRRRPGAACSAARTRVHSGSTTSRRSTTFCPHLPSVFGPESSTLDARLRTKTDRHVGQFDAYS